MVTWDPCRVNTACILTDAGLYTLGHLWRYTFSIVTRHCLDVTEIMWRLHTQTLVGDCTLFSLCSQSGCPEFNNNRKTHFKKPADSVWLSENSFLNKSLYAFAFPVFSTQTMRSLEKHYSCKVKFSVNVCCYPSSIKPTCSLELQIKAQNCR